MLWLCFYQTRSAWSMDQGSTKKRSAVHNFVPTVTKFCVMWEGLSLPHDTKFGNCRGEIVDRRMVFIWSLIHGSGWSRLIKADPGRHQTIIWTNRKTTDVRSHLRVTWTHSGKIQQSTTATFQYFYFCSGGHRAKFLRPVILLVFQHCQNTR